MMRSFLAIAAHLPLPAPFCVADSLSVFSHFGETSAVVWILIIAVAALAIVAVGLLLALVALATRRKVPGASTRPSAVSRRASRIILGASALFVVVGLVLVWTLVRPRYKYTAVLRVSVPVNMISSGVEPYQGMPMHKMFLNTQAAFVRSSKVLKRILDRKEIQNTHWYREEGKRFMRATVPPLERLADALEVMPIRDSELIEVSIAVEQPQEAKLIVDAAVTEYSRLVSGIDKENSQRVRQMLTEKHERLEMEIESLRSRQDALSETAPLFDSEERRARLSRELDGLQSRHDELEMEIEVLSARLERLAVDDVPAEIVHVDRQNTGGQPESGSALRSAASQTAENLRKMISEKEIERDAVANRIGQEQARITEIRLRAKIEEEIGRRQELLTQMERSLAANRSDAKAPDRVSIESFGLVSSHPDIDRRVWLTALVLLLALSVFPFCGLAWALETRRRSVIASE